VGLVGCRDGIEALDEGRQTCGIGCLFEVFDEVGAVGNIELLGSEPSGKGFVCFLATAAIGGCEAEAVGYVEGEGGDMLLDCFGVRPNSCAFLASDVLDDFIEDFGDDEGVVVWIFVGFRAWFALVRQVRTNRDKKRSLL
jgi:hypothetical protein